MLKQIRQYNKKYHFSVDFLLSNTNTMASSRNLKPTEEKRPSCSKRPSLSTKPDLMSLFRMEFYKNKKDWRLSEDVKKEPPRLPSPTPQNNEAVKETNNIEPESEPMDLEQVSPHDEAFLFDKLVDTPPDIQPAPEPELPVAPALHNQSQHTSVHQSRPEEDSEAVWQDAQQEWCGLEAVGGQAETEGGQVETEGGQVETEGGQVETEGGQAEGVGLTACPQPTWPPDAEWELIEQMELLENLSYSELVRLADDVWLRHQEYQLEQECASHHNQYRMLDESTDFIRGANRAPHSSEIDLSVSHNCWVLRFGSPSDLGERALAAAARAHAGALRELLAEHAIRETMRFTPTNMSLPIQLEECPKSGTELSRLPDMLLAGSHRPPDTGRGRGRLRTDGHAGAGFVVGRPYCP